MYDAILYFDGNCILCNKCIKFIINRDHKQKFGIGFIDALPKDQSYDSIILSLHKNTYYHSTAIIKALTHLGGIYKLATIFYLLPKWLRDMLYKAIARNRYKWFGRYNSCPTLPIEWQKRLINKSKP